MLRFSCLPRSPHAQPPVYSAQQGVSVNNQNNCRRFLIVGHPGLELRPIRAVHSTRGGSDEHRETLNLYLSVCWLI